MLSKFTLTRPTITPQTVDGIIANLTSTIDALVALEAGQKQIATDKREEAHTAILVAEAAEAEALRATKIANNLHNLLNPQ